jgi:hypothetical protein
MELTKVKVLTRLVSHRTFANNFEPEFFWGKNPEKLTEVVVVKKPSDSACKYGINLHL